MGAYYELASYLGSTMILHQNFPLIYIYVNFRFLFCFFGTPLRIDVDKKHCRFSFHAVKWTQKKKRFLAYANGRGTNCGAECDQWTFLCLHRLDALFDDAQPVSAKKSGAVRAWKSVGKPCVCLLTKLIGHFKFSPLYLSISELSSGIHTILRQQTWFHHIIFTPQACSGVGHTLLPDSVISRLVQQLLPMVSQTWFEKSRYKFL